MVVRAVVGEGRREAFLGEYQGRRSGMLVNFGGGARAVSGWDVGAFWAASTVAVFILVIVWWFGVETWAGVNILVPQTSLLCPARVVGGVLTGANPRLGVSFKGILAIKGGLPALPTLASCTYPHTKYRLKEDV